uniref:Uncharacterized protein B15I20.160 n=1 Tax=Neurospora crassa TaxID=5141 RepID=Q9P3J5_NEUCS|nr:hypothetical protein [Neurospora crassa]
MNQRQIDNPVDSQAARGELKEDNTGKRSWATREKQATAEAESFTSKRTAWFRRLSGNGDTDTIGNNKQAAAAVEADTLLEEALDGYKEAFARPPVGNQKVANVNPTAILQSSREKLKEKGFQSPDQLSHQIRTVTESPLEQIHLEHHTLHSCRSAAGTRSDPDRVHSATTRKGGGTTMASIPHDHLAVTLPLEVGSAMVRGAGKIAEDGGQTVLLQTRMYAIDETVGSTNEGLQSLVESGRATRQHSNGCRLDSVAGVAKAGGDVQHILVDGEGAGRVLGVSS